MGYVRVSTEQQAEGGVSLAAQRAKLEAYAQALELKLIGIFEDAGASGKTLSRPGLRQALGALEEHRATALVVTKLDRLTRSVRDLGDLVEAYFGQRYALLSVSDSIDTRSAAGRLVLNVLASVSQWEREAISERTREALAHLRQQGVRLGSAGMGWAYTSDGSNGPRRLVERVESERSTIARATQLRLHGLSLRDIARLLQSEGHRTKRGGAWRADTVRRLLSAAGRESHFGDD